MRHTLTHCLLDHAARQPQAVFWRHLSGNAVNEMTFGALLARASGFAALLHARGVLPGEVALIFLPQSRDAIVAFFGAMLAGAIPSFMPLPSAKQHPSVYWPAHRALLQRIGRHALVSDRDSLAQMRAHGLVDEPARAIAIADAGVYAEQYPPHLPAEHDVALLQHSSGTTGLKKGVALSHRALLLQAQAYAARLAMDASDPIVSWLPLYHDMGLIACTVVPLVLGQTVTCLDPFQWVARPVSLLDAIQRFDAHFTWMPNFAFEHLVRTVPHDYAGDLSRMRAFIDCSEPCLAATFDRFASRFAALGVRRAQLQVCYAMAETVFAVSQTAVSQTGPGAPARTLAVDLDRLHADGVAAEPAPGGAATLLLSTGRPLPGLDVRIVAADGRDQPDGTVGEVVLGGAMLFDGYFQDPETTAARLQDGRYHTRDRGFLRDGELYVLGRQDDMLIVNGRNLHAHEVEQLVAALPGLKPGRAVAFGLRNDDIGSEELVVVAERDPQADPQADPETVRAIRRAVFEHTGIEAKVCRIVAPGWLVKTSSGKIGRGANRHKYLDDAAPEPARQPPSPPQPPAEARTLPQLIAFIAAWFKCPPGRIGAETVAGDVQGWDSLAHSTMILEIERAFAVRFDDGEIFGFACVGDLARRIDTLTLAGAPGVPAEDRVVHRSAAASIVRLGHGEGPDIVVFAGRSKSFGGLDLMDFASVFVGTKAEHATKYFVTDHHQDWYVTCFDEVVAKLNQLSDKPKILFGNSMGGYAALRFAAALRRVVGVLSLVPQSSAPPEAVARSGKRAGWRRVIFVRGVRYCILFGEAEDRPNKLYMRRHIADPVRQRIVIVRNCGHNLATYLNEEGLLSRVLECCIRPRTMADEIEAIVATLVPSPAALRKRAAQIRRRPGADAQRQPASAAASAADDRLARHFARADIGGEGRLTLEQAKIRLPKLAQSFASIDLQNRGYITLDDLRAYWRTRRDGSKSRQVATAKTS